MTARLVAILLSTWIAQALPVAPDEATGPPEPLRPEPLRRPHRSHPADAVRLRAFLAEDPPVTALRQAATALIAADPGRARSMLARVRMAGWLPEVRLLVERRFGRNESVDLGTAADPTALAPVGIDSVNDVRYQARATWDLSKIAFNPDELGAEAQVLRAGDARREIEALVIHLYFERRRLKLESLEVDDLDMPSGFRRDLRIAEIEAELDALTGGAFSRLAARLARRYPTEGDSRSEP